MRHKELGKYIVANEEFSIPELQKEFNLSYSVVRRYVEKLIRRGKVSKLDDLNFSYVKNETDPLFIYALWLVIDGSNFSLGYLQNKLNVGEEKIKAIINWMKKQNYVITRPFDSVNITKESFLKQYGSLDVNYKDSDAFMNWKIENAEEIKKYIKPRTSKKLFSDKEYYEALEKLCIETPKGSKSAFLSVLEKKINEYQNSMKMTAILIKIVGEIAILNEKQFQSLREVILA